MNASEFRLHLTQILKNHAGHNLLRIVLQNRTAKLAEYDGPKLLGQSLALADRYLEGAPGDVTLLLLPHSSELFLLHLGLILRGQVPAILAWPTSRIDAEKYEHNLLQQLGNLPAGRIITLPRLAESMGPWLPFPTVACPLEDGAKFEQAFTSRLHLDAKPGEFRGTGLPLPSPDALFLQFSGGTTGAQKAVVVTAPMLEAQLQNLGRTLQFSSSDSVVSWLPMYHDMGLIGCLWFPLWFGAPSLQFSATDWLLQPELLFGFIARYSGTFCWLPNFAFSYLASQRERMTGTYNVASMRGWINCSEPVRLRSMQIFAERFSDWGVRFETLQASYAMAETVFAVTQTKLEGPPAHFSRSQVCERTTAFQELTFDILDDVYVSSGSVIGGTEILIVDPDGQPCGPARPGQIQIRSQSLFSGYWGKDGFVTNSLSPEGWYSSGDYGFEVDGELYVIGRFKDIIIVGGQNVFPRTSRWWSIPLRRSILAGWYPSVYRTSSIRRKAW